MNDLEINWATFKSKFYKKEREMFEKLAYHLFCQKYDQMDGIFSYNNQHHIETNPINIKGEIIGFQAKYYDEATSIKDNKEELKSIINGAKTKYRGLNKIIFYINKEFTESTNKQKVVPKYQEEIESYANNLEIDLIWMVPSNIEMQLSKPENRYVRDYFFSVNNIVEVVEQEVKRALSENGIVAHDIMNERLNDYTEVFLPKLVKANLLDAFKDPAIQILFRSTEKTAICSDRKLDYELLSELLIHRINKKGDVNKKAAISRAVEIINNISNDALLILTLFHSITYFVPVSGNISEGLFAINNLCEKIIGNNQLPNTKDWIDNLEVNGVMNFNNFGKSKELTEYLFNKYKGYSQLWILKDSEEHNKILKELIENHMPLDIIVDHELNNAYVRLNLLNERNLEKLGIVDYLGNKHELNLEQKRILNDIFENSNFKNNKEDNNKILFESKLNEYESLKKLIIWWHLNIVPISIRLNSVGRAIAHTNVKNIDISLPDLD